MTLPGLVAETIITAAVLLLVIVWKLASDGVKSWQEHRRQQHMRERLDEWRTGGGWS